MSVFATRNELTFCEGDQTLVCEDVVHHHLVRISIYEDGGHGKATAYLDKKDAYNLLASIAAIIPRLEEI